MATELPAADPASPWMQHLERAHSLAHAAARVIEEENEPNAYLGPAARHLERAVGAMYDAFDGRADRVTAINLAHGRLWDGAILMARGGFPGAVVALRDACAELISAEERFPQVPLAGRPQGELRAAVDLPPLHVLERASLVPTFRAPPAPELEEEAPLDPLPEPTTFAELAAVAEMMVQRAEQHAAARKPRAALPESAGPTPIAPPGFAFLPAPAMSEDAFVRSWTRHCFEEIGMLGLQRTPLAGDDWRTSLPIERRLLHAVDAIAALGPQAVAYLESLAMDAPVANPMTIFAIALLGGCLEGRDALGAAERVLFHFGPADPVVAESFVSAMKLAPNPLVPGMLRSLLAERDATCREIAVEVLAHRGWLTGAEQSSIATGDDPRLLALVLPAMAGSRHRELQQAVDRALSHPDANVQAAALDAMPLASHPDAAGAARHAAGGVLGDRALLRVAIVGDDGDARWLRERATMTSSLAAIEALGWAGHLDALPLLFELVEGPDQAAQLAAATALDHLLGGSLTETIDIAPDHAEDVMVTDPDPDPPHPRTPLDALLGLARDPAPAGSPESIEAPSVDAARWRAHWLEVGRHLDPKQRIRRGQPYSPSVSLQELDRLPYLPIERRRLHRELAAWTGKITHFSPSDLVAVQERSIAAWGAHVRATTRVPGSWRRAHRAR